MRGRSLGLDRETLTEDELLGGCQHVEREGDLVLVAFPLEEVQERGCVEHCGRRRHTPEEEASMRAITGPRWDEQLVAFRLNPHKLEGEASRPALWSIQSRVECPSV